MTSLSEFIPILMPSEVIGFRDISVLDVVCRPEESHEQSLYGVINEYLRYSCWIEGLDFLPSVSTMPAAIITEAVVPELALPQIIVPDARRAVALAARHLHGYPEKRLKTIGVTGTKGKTTTVNLVSQWLSFLGCPCASLGTLGLRRPGLETVEVGYTTPLATDLYRILRHTGDAGVAAIAMEISSHAIALDRTYGLEPDVVVLTNVGRDHLDFHGDEFTYRETKKRLFQETNSWAVINRDDKLGAEIAASLRPKTLSYGFSDKADIVIVQISPAARGSELILRYSGVTVTIFCPLLGRFNAENFLAALGTCLVLGFSMKDLVDHAPGLSAVPGRLEFVQLSKNRLGVVDFAHTAESLEQVLITLRALTAGRIITVFGCGGDRDRGKRPLMGAVVSRLSDLSVVTSDNPRSENPLSIIDDILVGMPTTDVHVEVDRHKAIALADSLAQPGDMILLAGKGHERTQIFADHIEIFSDREELECLK